MVFSKKSSQALSRISLIILFISFFVALSLVEAKTSLKNSVATSNISKKKWAVLDGLRSAKVGMSEKQVLRAIKKDFKLSPSKQREQQTVWKKLLPFTSLFLNCWTPVKLRESLIFLGINLKNCPM